MRTSGTGLTNLKTALTTFPFMYVINISYVDPNTSQSVTLREDDIMYVNYFYDCDILKSCMQTVVIETTTLIPKDTEITLYIGYYKTATSYTRINWGKFYVTEIEEKKDTGTYLITCYDAMIKTMVDYITPKVYTLTSDTTFIQDKDYYSYSDDVYTLYTGERTGNPNTLGLYEYGDIVYPITLINYFKAICSYLGLTTVVNSIPNGTREIPYELYVDMGYKFRDVLDEICEASGSCIYIGVNGNIGFKRPTATDDTINEDYLNESNVNIGEKYGPINSIVLSRSAESDNVYNQDSTSIEQNGLCELKIIDNQIMNRDDRSDYLANLGSILFGLEYYEIDYSSSPQGIFYYQLMDKYSISIGNDTYPCLMTSDNLTIKDGIEENIYTDIPRTAETDYSKADTTDIRLNQAKIEVDKANARIDAKVSKDSIVAELNLAVEDNQGIVTIRGNNFILETDNASIDKYGNTELGNVKVRGGSVELQDDGTQENAGLKIDTLYQREDEIVNVTDVDNKYIVFHFKDKTYAELIEYNDVVIMSDNEITPTTLTLKCYTDTNNNQFLDVITTETVGHQEPLVTVWKTVKFENGTIPKDFSFLNIDNQGGLFQVLYVIDDDIMDDIKYLSVNQIKKTSYSGNGIETDILYPDDANWIYANPTYEIRQILDGARQPTLEDLQYLDFDRDGIITENDYNISVAFDNAELYFQEEKGHLSINNKFANNNIVGTDGQGNDVFNFGIGTGGYVKNFKADTMVLNGNNINNVFVRKPVELYYEANGSNSEITLNGTVNNFSMIEIFFGWQGGGFGLTSVKLNLATSKTANLTCHALNNNQLYIASSQWTVNTNDDKIAPTKSEYWVLKTNGYPTRTTTAMVYIFKIVGYY